MKSGNFKPVFKEIDTVVRQIVVLSLPKRISGVNSFEINEIQEEETEAP
jgi:hypothetical protein